MQLKKKFLLTPKKVAVGAMTVVMMASGVPAFAGEHGIGLGIGARLNLKTSHGDERRDARKELNDLSASLATKLRERARLAISTTGTVGTDGQDKACKKEARADFRAEIAAAREEREIGRKQARANFLEALRAARTTFAASFEAAVSLDAAAEVTAKLSARADYYEAVKSARRAYGEAKRMLNAEFRKSSEEARERYAAGKDACAEQES